MSVRAGKCQHQQHKRSCQYEHEKIKTTVKTRGLRMIHQVLLLELFWSYGLRRLRQTSRSVWSINPIDKGFVTGLFHAWIFSTIARANSFVLAVPPRSRVNDVPSAN